MNRRLTRYGVLAAAMWAALGIAPAAQAADALNGKTLYLNGPVSGGTACAACHGASPAANVSGVLKAANTPSVITSAFAANRGGMGSIYNGKFSAAEIEDLAAFIGNPAVTAAPAATLAPAALSFSGTAVGQASAALSTTLANSGNAALNIATLAVGGANAGDFAISGGSCSAGGTVAAGANCTVQLVFRPSAAGARSAALTISHNGAGGGSSATLSGTGNAAAAATISVSANALAFAALATGSTSPVQTITVSNPGQAPLAFSGITLSGANAGIFTLGGTCSTSAPVAPNASCTVTVQAAPVAAGAFAASVNLASNAGNGNVAIGLSGSASAPAPSLAANPAAVAFGAQPVGAAAATRDVTITNRGNVPVAFNSIAVSGAASVTIGSGGCAGTLAVAASCNVALAFAPAAEGNVTATLQVRSSAPDVTVGITGAGTTAAVARPALSDTGAIAFADTQVGQVSAAHRTTLANNGNAALKITSIVLNGSNQGDFALAGTCATGATVSPGGNCTIDSTFKPAAAGTRGADLLVQTDSGAQLSVHLGGNALDVPTPAPNLSSSPQSFDFGTTAVGGTAPVKRITLTNSGSTALVLNSAAFTGPFALGTGEANACGAFPLTLAPGASCELPVRFVPTAMGNTSGSVVLQAAGGNWSIPLNGQGGAAAPATVGQTSGQTPGQASNQGGGGCSAVEHGDDPMLAVLAVLAGTVLLWRRRQPAGSAARKNLINASGADE